MVSKQAMSQRRIKDKERDRLVGVFINNKNIVKRFPLRVGIKAVYFMYVGPQIVYVGKTNCLIQRIGMHINLGRKEFEYVTYIEIEDNKLRGTLELAYIGMLRPKYNLDGMENETYKKQMLGAVNTIIDKYGAQLLLMLFSS